MLLAEETHRVIYSVQYSPIEGRGYFTLEQKGYADFGHCIPPPPHLFPDRTEKHHPKSCLPYQPPSLRAVGKLLCREGGAACGLLSLPGPPSFGGCCGSSSCGHDWTIWWGPMPAQAKIVPLWGWGWNTKRCTAKAFVKHPMWF